MNRQLVVSLTLSILLFTCFFSLICDEVNASPGVTSVYSPASGETYYEGGSLSIEWTYSTVAKYVKIELFKSGSYYTTISSNRSNNGYYYWIIPSGYSSSSYYKIRVTSLLDDIDYAESGPFYINEKTITVTYPSSGQTLYKGDTQAIGWTSEDTMHYFKIELYKGSSSLRTINSNLYSSSINGYYSWIIPSDLSLGSNYKIKVTDLSNSNIYGYSGEFTLDERYIEITSPHGGETWFIGETYDIKWDSKNAGSSVSIKYKKEYDYSYNTITYSTNNNKSYKWTIPSGLNKNYNYQIKITSNSYSNIEDTSSSFSIDQRYIEVKTPRFGNEWLSDETHVIEWESENAGEYVDILLIKNNNYYATIATNIKNNGTYSWEFENIASDSNYQIQINSKEYSSAYDRSEIFTISGRTITVKSPADGDVWYKGESYDITWEQENSGDYVDIKLYRDGDYVKTIASNLKNNGKYRWNKIPSDLELGSSYQIWVGSVENKDVYAFSEGSFTIDETFFQKILNSVFFIIIIAVVIISAAVVFLKVRKKWLKPDKNTPATASLEFNQKAFGKTDISHEEYDQIWEGKY